MGNFHNLANVLIEKVNGINLFISKNQENMWKQPLVHIHKNVTDFFAEFNKQNIKSELVTATHQIENDN